MPLIRVIPLPVHKATTSTTTSSATVASSSSSSTVVPVTPTILRQTATFNSGTLAAGDSFTGSVSMAMSFQMISISADSQCEVRLYGTQDAQFADLSRAPDAPVPAEVTVNLITCVALDTAPFNWSFQGVDGANQDPVTTTKIYVTVINTDTAAVANISVMLTYVPVETA